MKNTINILLFLLISHLGFGQEINEVYSANGDFFLKTTPYADNSSSAVGKTEVYAKDFLKKYEIPRYFAVWDNYREIFISDDGDYVVYVVNRDYEYEDVQYKSVELYRKGVKFKEYSMYDLTDCGRESDGCHLRYSPIDSIIRSGMNREVVYKKNISDFEKKLSNRAIYFSDDTLYIFSNHSRLIKLNVRNGELWTNSYANKNSQYVNGLDTMSFKSIRVEEPPNYYDYLDSMRKHFELALAEHLDMVIFPEDFKVRNTYKKYAVFFDILVSSEGAGEILSMRNYDNLPEDKIKTFVDTFKFKTTAIPQQIDKRIFLFAGSFMKSDTSLAMKEKEIEKIEKRRLFEQRIVADSIDGRYIPKNLEECFIELDKILKPNDRKAIKELEAADDTALFHFGLGMWLRNNWGLWGGSRIQQYLESKGIDHPDSMSGVIINYYYDWLNERHDKWKAFEQK